MAYPPSAITQQKRLSQSVHGSKRVRNLMVPHVKKRILKHKKTEEIYDEEALFSSVPKSPIYVHEMPCISNRILSSASDRVSQTKNGSNQNVFHSTNRNHHWKKHRDSLSPKITPRKARKSKPLVRINSKILNQNEVRIEETHWTSWTPIKVSKKTKQIKHHITYGIARPAEAHDETKIKSTETNMSTSNSNREQDEKQQNLDIKQVYVTDKPKETNSSSNEKNKELTTTPTQHSVKTNLSYYSQEFETNEVDYDVDRYLILTKEGSTSPSTKTIIHFPSPHDGDSSNHSELSESPKSTAPRASDDEEINPLRHVDSLILNTIKRNQGHRSSVQQPLAIRIFKHKNRSTPVKVSESRHLKPILKRTQSLKSASPIRLGKPETPTVISSKGRRKK